MSRDGTELSLGKLSFDLLDALIRAAPTALSSDEIVARVWSGDAVSDENIKQRVSLLRRALVLAVISLLLLITVLAIAARQLKRSRVGTMPQAGRVEERAFRPDYRTPSRLAVDSSNTFRAVSSTRLAASSGASQSRSRYSSGQWSSTFSTSMVNTSTPQVPPHFRYS